MKIGKLVAVSVILTIFVSCGKTMGSKASLETKIDSVSYALGVDMAYKIQENFGTIDKDLFIQGYLNVIDSTDLLLKAEDLKIIGAFMQQRRIDLTNERQIVSRKQLEKRFTKNKQKGEEFLAYNKKKKGVTTTKSGLQYEVLKQGNGKQPTVTSKVKVHYTGKIINGTIFESTKNKKQPSEFFLNQMMKGWTEGLQLMKEGSKYRFYIPQELAYGPRYQNKYIQPFSALVFDVELIAIVKK